MFASFQALQAKLIKSILSDVSLDQFLSSPIKLINSLSGGVPVNFQSLMSTSFAVRMSADVLPMSAKIDQDELDIGHNRASWLDVTVGAGPDILGFKTQNFKVLF